MDNPWIKPEDFQPWLGAVPKMVEFYEDGYAVVARVESDESAIDEFPDLQFFIDGLLVDRYDFEYMRSFL